MFIDFSWVDFGWLSGWLSSLSYFPIFLYPDCPDYCKKCGKEIEGSSFWKFSIKLYCNKCRPYLSKEEWKKEREQREGFRSLLKDTLPLLGRPLKKNEKPEETASEMFINAAVGRKIQEDKKISKERR